MSNLKQNLQQQLQMKLGPRQIMLMRLIQLPALALEQRIKEELENNPALEEEGDTQQEESTETAQDEEIVAGIDEEAEQPEDDTPKTSPEDEFNLNDFLEDDETPSYRMNVSNRSPDDEVRVVPIAMQRSFHENLTEQLGQRDLTDNQYLIGHYIIGNLDDDGYLRRDVPALVDDLAFSQNIIAKPEEILHVLEVVQEFDPPGVGSRSLQECLLIQLKRKNDEQGGYDLPVKIITGYFPEFSKKNYSKIRNALNISEEKLSKALDEITRLNPRPGGSTPEGGKSAIQVIPDFIMTIQDNQLELTLTYPNMPDLRLSRMYTRMLEEYAAKKKKNDPSSAAALEFIIDKIERAKQFITMIRDRSNTLLRTMQTIMDFQKEYFQTGDDTKRKPMVLKDIADITGYDISTISRVSNSKYVQTPYGTFPLKSFFSESLQNEKGEEVSSITVKKLLQEIIAGERKKNPYTDEQLCKILKDKGYPIARRTVAKYREMAKIPTARLRKKL